MPQDMNTDSDRSLSEVSWNKATSDSTQEDAASAGHDEGAMGSLKEGARSLGDQAKERASRYVEGGKTTVTEHLDTFAQAIRAASDELRDKDQTMAAQLVRQAAGGLESLSRSIGGTSLQDMVTSVRSFGRSNPTAFIGVSVLAGLALGRFVRASSPGRRDDWDDRRSEPGNGRGDAGSGSRDWDRSRSGFNEGFQPYSGPSYPTGERASFAPSTHGGADTPPRGQGYAGGGMRSDPIQSSSPSPEPSSERDASVSVDSHSGGAAQPGSISTGGSS